MSGLEPKLIKHYSLSSPTTLSGVLLSTFYRRDIDQGSRLREFPPPVKCRMGFKPGLVKLRVLCSLHHHCSVSAGSCWGWPGMAGCGTQQLPQAANVLRPWHLLANTVGPTGLASWDQAGALCPRAHERRQHADGVHLNSFSFLNYDEHFKKNFITL